MSTKTASRILLSALIIGPWAFSAYLLISGYAPYGVLFFLLGLVFLLWLWKPWRPRKQKRHGRQRSDAS